MVTEALIAALLGAFRALVSTLPVADVDTTGWADTAGTIFANLAAADGWIPLDELMLGLTLLMTGRFLVLGYSALRSAWDALPFT